LILFVVSLYYLWPNQESNEAAKTSTQNVEAPKLAKQPVAINEAKGSAPAVVKKPAVVKPAVVEVANKVEEGARLNLQGHSLIKQGRYQEAVSTLHQAIDTFPENSGNIEYVFAQYNLAHSLRKIGKSEEAIPYLKRCIAYDSHNVMFQKELQAAQRDLSRN
jgi:tetratricopeptide (TPR) repeat protein